MTNTTRAPLPSITAPTPPPFRLLGLHFGAALSWLAVGSAGLVSIASELAWGNFLAPRVLAVTHMFTLGLITTTIFGVLYQFYPMSLGAGARSIRVAFAGAWALQLGILLLVVGFWYWHPLLLGVGWLMIFAAVGCVSWNLLPHRRRMTQGRRVAGYVSAGHAALGFAMLLAAARIGEPLGWWSVDRLGLIAAHFHLAAFGFAGLTAVGVASRMLPMFMVAHGAPDWLTRVIGPMAAVGLVVLAPGQMFRMESAIWLGAFLLVTAGALFLTLVAGYFNRRLVRRLEPAFGHVAVGFGCFVGAMAAGIAILLSPGFSPRAWVAYGLLTILGWLTLFIVGIYYRILPFLLWLNLSRGARRATTPAELISRRWAWASLVAMAAGVLVMVITTLSGAPVAARAGAAVFAAGSISALLQYPRILVRLAAQREP